MTRMQGSAVRLWAGVAAAWGFGHLELQCPPKPIRIAESSFSAKVLLPGAEGAKSAEVNLRRHCLGHCRLHCPPTLSGVLHDPAVAVQAGSLARAMLVRSSSQLEITLLRHSSATHPRRSGSGFLRELGRGGVLQDVEPSP